MKTNNDFNSEAKTHNIGNLRRFLFGSYVFNIVILMKSQGKSPKQMRDSLTIFELAFWSIVLIVVLILIFVK